ncbi:hypothetical protein ABW21_db0204231 [Orbilia brochopaga]|nr:hypothetical protein ABW21_db0204231 [Drechslerella brochopaga]
MFPYSNITAYHETGDLMLRGARLRKHVKSMSQVPSIQSMSGLIYALVHTLRIRPPSSPCLVGYLAALRYYPSDGFLRGVEVEQSQTVGVEPIERERCLDV